MNTRLLHSVLVWEKKEKVHCSGAHYGNYETMEAAISACTSDDNCSALYDGSCDNQGFYLCKKGFVKEKKSKSG